MVKVGGIIVAAGRGERMGAPLNKVYLSLGDRPLLLHSIGVFEASPALDAYVVVAHPAEVSFCRTLLAAYNPKKLAGVIAGGTVRQESVAAGLRGLPEDCRLVVVHDGARPLVTVEVLEGAITRAGMAGAVVVGVPVKDTVKIAGDGGVIRETPERNSLWLAQTPQIFRRDLLLRAHREAEAAGFQGTDDAALVERLGVSVQIYQGNDHNIKITTPEDMSVAQALLEQRNPGKSTCLPARTGIGYDVHPFAAGRTLVLGGVEIPGADGLAGHSDADVLLHALMDACLGAAGLEDIGHYFPPADVKWKDANSLALLAAVRGILAGAGLLPSQVDAVVAAERPRLAPYLAQMKERIAGVLGIPAGAVGLKATTNESLGFVGRGEGIAAWAVATLVGYGLE